MATFNTDFFNAGKESAVKIPGLDAIERSSQRNSQLAIRGEEMKLERAVKDRDTFLKMLDVDPVAATTDWNTKRQALAYEKHLTNATLIEQKSGGHPSAADLIKIQSSKNELIAEQNRILAEQKQIENATALASRDTRGYYDRDAFYNNLKEYNATGKLPIDVLPIAPQSMTAWLGAQSKNLPRVKVTEERDVLQNGKPTGQKVRVDVDSATKEDAQIKIAEGLQEPARMKQTVMDFDAWSKKPENQQAYQNLFKDYDRHKNGIVSPEENKYAHSHIDATDNPIMQWALNNPEYLRTAMKPTDLSSKNIPSSGKGAGTVNTGGVQIKMNPAIQREGSVTYGNRQYIRPYSFGGQKFNNVPTQNGTQISSDGTEETLESGTMEGNLLHYDAGRDVLIFSNASATNNPSLKSNDIVEVPADNFANSDNLPIIINGRAGTVGELRKKPQQLIPSSGVSWVQPKKK